MKELRAFSFLASTLACVSTAFLLVSCTGEPEAPVTQPPASEEPARRPPPISGGTLLVAWDGSLAFAADPDRDRVSVVDLARREVLTQIALQPGDEPGRLVDGDNRVFVALRGGGAVAVIDILKRQLVARWPVCSAPRGLAYDAATNLLHVACAGGELVTLSAADGSEQYLRRLGPDLRDVVIQGDRRYVTHFRAADVVALAPDGTVVGETSVEPASGALGAEPDVAWRMVAVPGGGVAIVHQRAALVTVPTTPNGYGGPLCSSGVVRTAVSFVDGATLEASSGPSIGMTVLPVDLALSNDGATFAVVAAGSDTVFESPITTYRNQQPETMQSCPHLTAIPVPAGQPIAVAYRGPELVIQTREPPALVFRDGSTIPLPGEKMWDTGHELFHRPPNAKLSLACASCHPEGRDDGRVWRFDIGERRTPSLAGGVLGTAPFHWKGELAGFDSLMNEVFTKRMGGQEQSARHILALATWLDAVPRPALPPARNPAAAQHGEALFASAGCTSCHSGPLFTNNQTIDVGTGTAFQVPSLRGVALRAPYMHDGCAPTLRDRFTNPQCGGGDAHGHTSQLSPSELDDLVAYLETL